MFMMNKNIVTNLQYHRVLVMWKMILLALLLLTVSCKSQNDYYKKYCFTNNYMWKMSRFRRRKDSVPSVPVQDKLFQTPKEVQTGLLESVPYVMVVDEHLFDPCELCNGTGEISIANILLPNR